MRRIHDKTRLWIFSFLDIFYPLFRRFLPIQTYHYAACGGGNTLFNIFLYHMFYNYLFHAQVVHFGPFAFTPHIAAFLLAFSITFPIGFYLSMFIVFHGSFLRKRIQLVRYFLVALACVVLNYVLLKFFIEVLGWYRHPTLSLMLTAAIVIAFSYLSQRYFSFKKTAKARVPSRMVAPSMAEVKVNGRYQEV